MTNAPYATSRPLRPISAPLDPNVRVADVKSPRGYQNSHRIPESLQSSDFYEQIAQAREVDAQGELTDRQVWDIQRAVVM